MYLTFLGGYARMYVSAILLVLDNYIEKRGLVYD